jgi:hypothetical protein
MLSWLTIMALFPIFSIPAAAGSGGYFLPPNYHPLDNLWKIGLTIAVIWIIVSLLRRPGQG